MDVNDKDRLADDNASAKGHSPVSDIANLASVCESVESSDSHHCGQCKLDFVKLVDYINHKLSHDNCKVTYKRVNKRALPHLVRKDPKPAPQESGGIRKRKKKQSDTLNEDNIVNESMYSCEVCQRSFRREAALKRHQEHDHRSHNDPDNEDDEEYLVIDEHGDNDGDKDTDYKAASYAVPRKAVISSEQTADEIQQEGKEAAGETPGDKELPAGEHEVRPYKCEECGKLFKVEGVLRSHMLRHSDYRGFPCQVQGCPFAFKTKGSLKRHMRRHTDERPFNCKDCGRSFRESGALIRHQKSRTPCTLKTDRCLPRYGKVLDFVLPPSIPAISHQDHNETGGSELPDTGNSQSNTCKACFEQFADQTSLQQHLEEVHISPAPLRCGLCSFATDSNVLLNTHMQTCHQADLQIGSSDQADETGVSEDARVTTDITRQASTALEQLLQLRKPSNPAVEMRIANGGRVFTCEVCSKQFITRDSYMKHMSVHSDERQYKCGECGKLFKRITHVRQHLRIHSAERPFPCSLCPKRFKTHNAAKVHERTHQDDMPWTCMYCSKSFKEKASLTRHVRTHTGEKPYPCPKCGRTFREHGTLRRHMKCKVPCTLRTPNDEAVSVLVQFSSVVRDDQQVTTDQEVSTVEVNEEEQVLETTPLNPDETPSEYIVVDSSGQAQPVQNMEVLGDSVPYVIVEQPDNSFTLVRLGHQQDEAISIEGLTSADEVTEALKAVSVLRPDGESMRDEHVSAIAMVPEADEVVAPTTVVEIENTVVEQQTHTE